MDLFLIAASDGGGRRRDDPVDHRGDLRHRRDRHLDPRRGALRHRPDHRRSVDRTWRRQYLLLIGVTREPSVTQLACVHASDCALARDPGDPRLLYEGPGVDLLGGACASRGGCEAFARGTSLIPEHEEDR